MAKGSKRVINIYRYNNADYVHQHTHTSSLPVQHLVALCALKAHLVPLLVSRQHLLVKEHCLPALGTLWASAVPPSHNLSPAGIRERSPFG